MSKTWLAMGVFVVAGCGDPPVEEESLPDVAAASTEALEVGILDGETDDVAAGVAAQRDPVKESRNSKKDEAAERLKIEGYKGPTIYLPSPQAVPPPTVVETKTLNDEYENGKPRITRGVRVMSDNTFVNHGPYVEHFENGQKFVEGEYVNGVQEGEWNYWYDNGQLCKSVTYKEGMPDGSWEVFRQDGTKQFARSYSNGKKQGKWLVFADDGESVLREESYADGAADGLFIQWYPNGQKHTEFPYKNGQRDGVVREWSEDGKLLKEYEFVKDERHGKSTTWTDDGEVIVQQFENNKLVPKQGGNENES